MKAEEWRRLAVEFDRLCDLAGAEREERLERLGASEPELVAELRAMLAADSRETGALSDGLLGFAPAAEEALPGVSGTVTAGVLLGPWQLVEPLGEGGMGEVWVARRADGAFEQEVAVKLLRRGLETDALLKRFLLERQILARLVHPGIARLLDAGSTEDGRPYFVMERVVGEPITSWANGRRLSLEARVALVIAVADAVDFAHRNLVVHRDLKPSNVMVVEPGEIKLLDFGIAKLLEREQGATLTEFGGRALTPAYAAPEQIRGEPVTTATDVFALGVLLYELLTGRLPHRRGRKSLPDLAVEVQREVVERPSSAVRGEGAGEPVAGLAAERLARRLAGDLDTILLKALAPEAERRYPTAAALAEDLRRFLDGRPIAARPDAFGYRLGKFVRRHRLAVGMAGAVLVALVAGLGAALWQAERATREARRAGRVRDFLVSVFESRDPDLGAGRHQTVEQLVDESAERLAAELAGEPEAEADLADALARAETSLGRYETAERLGTRALELRRERFGEPSGEVAASLTTLGIVAHESGDDATAERLLREAIAQGAATVGSDALETSRARVELSATHFSQGRFAEALAQAERGHRALLAGLGPNDRRTLRALSRRADAAIHGGDRTEAERILREALSGAGEGSPTTPLTRAILRRELADALHLTRRNDEARREIDQALAEIEGLLGEQHLEVVMTLHLRSNVLGQAADFEGAKADARRALAILDRIDADHPLRGMLLSDLGNYALHMGQHEVAIALHREDLARMEASYAADSTRILQARSVLAGSLHVSGRDDEALEQLEIVVARLRADPRLGASILPSAVLGMQSEILRARGRLPEAISASRLELECLRLRTDQGEAGFVVEAELNLGLNLVALGTPPALAEARQLAEGAVSRMRTEFMSVHAGLPQRLLAKIDVAEGRLEEGRRHLERALAAAAGAGYGTKAASGEMHLELGLLLERLGETAAARSELEQAESLLFRRKGRDHPDTRQAREASARLAGRRTS